MFNLSFLRILFQQFKNRKLPMRKNKISDVSIDDPAKDKLKFTESIIPRIFNIVKDESYFPLTVAITGEWGAGKTSVINLLKNKLKEDRKNVIITFDPLIEGKQTVSELIELFYLKIIQEIKNKKIKKVLKKLLISLLTVTRFKTSLQVTDPIQSVTIGLDKDFGADIDKLIKIWEKNEPKLLSQHAKEINSILSHNQIRLYIFIDEIDRLNSEHIISFLLFSRVLEAIDHLVCVIGLDYNRTIRKLVVEKKLGSSNYNDVKFYLDKLITLSFHVDATLDNRLELLSEFLIEHHICNQEFIHKYAQDLRDICDYLSTPRGIKKFLILASANKEIIEYSGKKISVLKLLAIEVVNPIIKEYITKNEDILYSISIKTEPSIISLIKNNNKVDDGIIKKVLLGIIDPQLDENDLLDLRASIPHFITDPFNNKYILDILESLPRSVLHAYIRNFYQLEFIKVYFDFFKGDITNALEVLANLPHQNIADDISYALHKNIIPKNVPKNINPETLNKLWLKNVNYLAGSPYTHIALYLAPLIPLEIFIRKVDLSFSESLIHRILKVFNINNKKGVYELDDFRSSTFQDGNLNSVIFKDEAIQNFNKEHIQEILSVWLDEVSSLIQSKDIELIKMENSISIFYRYVQWGQTLKIDNRVALHDYLNHILQNNLVSDEVKRSFCKRMIDANKFNTNFNQGLNEDKIFEELFGSTILKPIINTLASN